MIITCALSPFTSPSPSAESDKLQSKLDALKKVEKLCEFYDNVSKSQNDPKNLLDNLCDGLQTFLGFNKDSKGYTGQGIVYSDLDRLCDAVMGFLSGVLEGVKNENEVTTYDKHLEKKLNEVLEELNSKIGTGRDGLVLSVGAVQGWLEGYEGEMGRRILNFKKPFKTILDVDVCNFNDKITEMKSHDPSLQLNVWSKAIKDATIRVDRAKTALLKLDNNLRNKLAVPMRVMEDGVKTFIDASKNNDLQVLSGTARDELQRLETDVKKYVSICVNHMRGRINHEFQEQIEQPINTVKNKLTQLDLNLKQWISVAQDVIQQVKKKATEVHERLLQQTNTVNAYAELVKNEATKNDSIIFQTVNSHMQLLRETSDMLDKASLVVEGQLRGLTHTAEGAVNNAKSNAKKLTALDGNIKGDLKTRSDTLWLNSLAVDINDIKTSLTELVDSVKVAIGDLSEALVSKNLKTIKGLLESFNRDYVMSLKKTIEVAKDEFSDLDVHKYPTVNYFKFIVGSDTKGTTIFDKFQNALENPPQTQLAVAVTRAPIARNEDKSPAGRVDAAINVLADKVTQLETEFQSKIKNSLDEAVRNVQLTVASLIKESAAIADVRNGTPNDVDLLEEHITKLRSQLDTLIRTVSEGKLTEKIDNVSRSIAFARTTIVEYIQDTAEHYNSLTAEYTKLHEELKKTKAGDDVITTLEDLDKHGINGTSGWEGKGDVMGLQNIKQRIENEIIGTGTQTPNTLMKILKDTGDFYNVIHEEVKNAITEINRFVASEVSSAMISIRSRTQTLYAERKKGEVENLTTTIRGVLADMEIIVDANLKSGVKGLMKWMKGSINFYGIRVDNKIDALISAVRATENDAGKFRKISDTFLNYFCLIYEHIKFEVTDQTKPPTNSLPTDQPTDPYIQLTKIKGDFDNLLNHLHTHNSTRKYIFDNDFTEKLASFKSATNDLSPSHFANPRHPELLDAVKKGLQGFVGEMERVYVNGYDGHKETINFDELVILEDGKDKLTNNGKNLSKVFLTIMNTIYDDLHKLKFECEHYWKDKKLCETEGDKDNPLGLYLKRCGYTVAKKDTSKDGELNFPLRGYTGRMIYDRFAITTASTSSGRLIMETVDTICNYINNYNDVGHLSTLTSKRHPCSVYEMLCWLSGLPHNPAYLSLRADALPPLMQSDKPTTDKDDDIDIDFYDHASLYIDTYPKRTTYSDIDTLIEYLCSRSYDVITCIAGTGDAETVYGSDFCNNAIRLHYPQNGSDCLDMLLDILRRLFLPLKFLQRQCGVSVLYNGWRQCYYGRDVSTANWPCKEHPRSEPKCESNCQAKCEPNCQAKSPLMSYLNDCLPGHLPHQLSKIGCQLECSTCSGSKPGMPCLTPLGFKGFSGSKRAGKDICDVLDRWFNIHHFKDIFCLNTKTPSSLPEHFGFALSLANNLNDRYTGQSNSMETVNDKFQDAMKSVSMKLYSEPSKLTQAVTNAYGATSIKHANCSQHLMNLTRDGICADAGVYCAPFLYSLCSDYCTYRRRTHAGTYLSWAVYLPWNLWNYLRSLYDEFGDIVCKNWGCRSCLNSDTCKPGEHGILDNSCKCSTVVNCGGVSPTLYKYGFVFGNAANLKVHKNTCFQMRTQLMNVLKSTYFTDIFKECDEFLFTIRQPFIWLNVALWLLSLLYLLHIMVIRLDLLHIKSHLNSPSSHRIAAQSLLAAARVNKLNRVFYLQP